MGTPHATLSSSSSSSSGSSRQRRSIRYRFVSIDEECAPPSPSPSTPTEPSMSSSSPPCFSLLQRFYDELMVPTFPIEEERDDVEDWIECFRDQIKLRRHRIRQQHKKEVKEALTDGLEEEGIALSVQRLADGDCDDRYEEDCEFDGPAMDVILMLQEDGFFDSNIDETNRDGNYFFKRKRSSLRSSQSSLCGGIYAPKDGNSADPNGGAAEDNAKRCSSISSFGSLSSLLETLTSEDDANTRVPHGDDGAKPDNAKQLVKRGSRSSFLNKQGSLYGGLYAPTQGEQEGEEKKEGVNIRELKQTIIGGAAVEYYKRSRVGLLSYVVLRDQFRGCGLARHLHEEALTRLEMLANRYGTAQEQTEPLELSPLESLSVDSPPKEPSLRVVFAETNTLAAGDVSPEQSLLRHKSLFNLGYRLVEFPYAQPPLSTEDVNASFDDIVLLVYFPFDQAGLERQHNPTMGVDGRAKWNRELMERFCSWYFEFPHVDSNTVRMDVDIPFRYIEEFYESVFGLDLGLDLAANKSDGGESDTEGIPDYRDAEYYKLAHWFAHDSRKDWKGLGVSLDSPTPWEDCKDSLVLEWKEWRKMHQT